MRYIESGGNLRYRGCACCGDFVDHEHGGKVQFAEIRVAERAAVGPHPTQPEQCRVDGLQVVVGFGHWFHLGAVGIAKRSDADVGRPNRQALVQQAGYDTSAHVAERASDEDWFVRQQPYLYMYHTCFSPSRQMRRPRAESYSRPMSESEVESHLAQFDGPQAVALRRTRDLIATALPGAEQVIAYGMPTFKVDGVAVVGFDGFKQHNSLFPYSGGVVALVAAELPDWVVAKGTIRFPLDKPFPAPLLKRVLALRIQEINASYPKKSGQTKEFYNNGVLKLKGGMKNGQMHGAWQWFRRDGSMLRAGRFREGIQTGEWVTYDRTGNAIKSTRF